MKKLIFILLVFLTAGCQRQMAYHETLRPNADISNDAEWSKTEATFYESLNQEAGVVSPITGQDANRIASWNGKASSSTDASEFRVGWSDWQGQTNTKIGKLEFRYVLIAMWGSGQTVKCEVDVYIDGSLLETIDIETPTSVISFGGNVTLVYTVADVEIDLDGLISPTSINTLETVFRNIATGVGNLKEIYAIQCEVYESEKIIDPETPLSCKTIPADVPLEKKI